MQQLISQTCALDNFQSPIQTDSLTHSMRYTSYNPGFTISQSIALITLALMIILSWPQA